MKSNPQFAADLIAEMTRNVAAGSPEEYARIPWIWRVAIAAGKRNDAEQLRRILSVSLPREDEPLRDWQAVVIGGGVINGISQRDQWPRERLAEILGADSMLQRRLNRAIDLASSMADNANVPSGTRYDALRMLGVEEWARRGVQLAQYLKDKNGELQMGAVSALANINAPEATRALADALPELTKQNRQLAVAALLRTVDRRRALLAAIDSKKVPASELSAEQMAQLRP